MEPINKWEETYKTYCSYDPATNYYTFDYGKFKFHHPESESEEEKIQTLNESTLKEIKP
jgi:hypothetical protein